MCTKPISQTKNKGKLSSVVKSSGPLLARMPLKVYVTAAIIVQVHGSVYFFIKSISPSSPRTIKVVASLVLQCAHVVLSAIHLRTLWNMTRNHRNKKRGFVPEILLGQVPSE